MMLHSSLLLPPDPARQFIERWGGYLIALNFCIALTFLLLFVQVSRPQLPIVQEEQIRVVLKPEPTPEPLPNEELVAEQTPPPSTTVAGQAPPLAMDAPKTTASETESEQESEVGAEPEFVPDAGTEAAKAESGDLESKVMEEVASVDSDVNASLTDESKPELDLIEPPTEPEPEPTPEVDPLEVRPMNAAKDVTRAAEEAKFLEEIESRKEALKNYNKEVAAKGSEEVADRLQKASLAQQGKKWLTTTDGIKEGIIRSLDISDVPQGQAQEVLERYGIKIMMKMMDGESGGYNFLNQAKTGSGTYYNRVGKGMYQVFSFGQPAVARMMQLEMDELRRRGYDPAKTRVTEVEFGIVQSTRGYDLGVKKIEMLPVEVTPQVNPN